MIACSIRDTRAWSVARGRRIVGDTPFGYTSDKRGDTASVDGSKGGGRPRVLPVNLRQSAAAKWRMALPWSEAGEHEPATCGPPVRSWTRPPTLSPLAASDRPKGRGQEHLRPFWMKVYLIAAPLQSRRDGPVRQGAVATASGLTSRGRTAVRAAER